MDYMGHKSCDFKIFYGQEEIPKKKKKVFFNFEH